MKRSRGKKEKKASVKKEKAGAGKKKDLRPRKKAHALPEDSDEESEGEWIAKEPERRVDLGQAGGSEDEDAEGGGETLGSVDSEQSADEDSEIDDSLPRAQRRSRRTTTKAPRDSTSQTSTASDSDPASSDSDNDSDNSPSTLHDKHPAPSTKIRHLLRILHTESPAHKTIVFSQFTTMLDLLPLHLSRAKLPHVRYDGRMKPDAREAALNSLRNDPKIRVLLCSLKCGSLGLNLTAASRVVILEPFWNPFVEEQAIDRVHRLNQTVDVKVFRLT
ncbi:hypothetical protein LTR53_018323, partial [Teratosphaeriaceae sp. CCFEE 6253]